MCHPKFKLLVPNSLTSLDVISLGKEVSSGLDAVEHFVLDEFDSLNMRHSHLIGMWSVWQMHVLVCPTKRVLTPQQFSNGLMRILVGHPTSNLSSYCCGTTHYQNVSGQEGENTVRETIDATKISSFPKEILQNRRKT